ncbi:MAG: thioredoxin fold domain-containing protein [Magnetococcales bacterium]|nr:thioredoxin fold domain-containing protein [Magnetococcales bacterium]
MVNRRLFLLLFTLVAALSLSTPAQALFQEPFFEDSFLNLSEDAQDAAQSGRILMVFYEQEGCPYCTRLHKETLSDPKVRAYLTKHFYPIMLDLFGSRALTDFKGNTMPEKKFVRKQGVHFTPTIVFYGADGAQLFRVSGFWKPLHFLTTMQFVAEKRYEEENLQDYLHKKLRSGEAKLSGH